MDRKRILIVDDEPVNIMTLSEILKNDYELHTANDATEALKIVRDGVVPDLVLLDISMPGVDGYDLCRKLSRTGSTKRTPVIFVTGKLETADEVKGFEAGAVDYITKPVTPVVVKARVGVHLKLRTALSNLDEMLNKTLLGSVQLLIDMLSVARPLAFAHASRVSSLLNKLQEELGVERRLEYEFGAMLSQLGCLMLPEVILRKVAKAEELSIEEALQYEEQVALASAMLRKIPRMEAVADIIAGLGVRQISIEQGMDGDVVATGVKMLQVALGYDRLVAGAGMKPNAAIRYMRGGDTGYDTEVLDGLQRILDVSALEMMVKSLDVDDLTPAMLLDEDVYSDSGVLLATRGMAVSGSVHRILTGYRDNGNLKKRIRVMIPMISDSE